MSLTFRPNASRGRKRFLAATALVFVLLAVDALTGGSIRALARGAGSAVWGAGVRVSEAVAGSGVLSSRRALLAENEALREELSMLRISESAALAVREENEALRALAHLAEAESGIATPIVSAFRSSPYGTFMIGAGRREGIHAGDLVLASDVRGSFALGRIAEVGETSSLVRALFAPGGSVDATIAGVGVTLEGRGGGQARGDVPREALIEAGALAVSPEAGARAIGVVAAVEESAGGASLRVYVHLPVNLSDIRFVYIIPAP